MSEKMKERLKFFALGMLSLIGITFMVGAANSVVNDSGTVVIENGRYQISSWGDSKAHGAFIVDTITGETKIAYRYKETNSEPKERNNLNMPFSAIK